MRIVVDVFAGAKQSVLIKTNIRKYTKIERALGGSEQPRNRIFEGI